MKLEVEEEGSKMDKRKGEVNAREGWKTGSKKYY